MANAEIEVKAVGGTALLIIDMITDLDFPGGGEMLTDVRRAAETIADLCGECRSAGVPIVYVNDNHGEWHSERSKLIKHIDGTPGAQAVQPVMPRDDDFFVVKPQFSGFYATSLPVLLPRLGVTRLILTGISADICVLFTAADAHMREYEIWVPGNCVASQDKQRTRWALDIMANSMRADVACVGELSLADWIAREN